MYINMYFTEFMDRLNGSAQRRSFDIYVDDKPVQSMKPVTPIYGNVTEVGIYIILAMDSTTFTLVSTSNSTLPPIISAVELFEILDYTLASPNQTASSSSMTKLPVILGTVVPVLLVLMALMK
ncbi:hypothetical protein CRG98_017696 [Punica granatum]|uniref:Malectin-like domain-containing protein n=1 Tax=Punica granatum TaxID=22663 RepID=A0A2I0K1I2_PUNGR|nr:hypothetical protein CRG98_017696 [Punica granatum]